MVHGLAQPSGGQLTLKSKKGEGTIAELWLPVAAAERPKHVEAHPVYDPNNGPLSVLTVDDDPLVLTNPVVSCDQGKTPTRSEQQTVQATQQRCASEGCERCSLVWNRRETSPGLRYALGDRPLAPPPP
jgi:hypothetical protein